MSSPPKSPQKSPSRPSKFIEGDSHTRPDLLQGTPASNDLFFHIISEMDEHEKRRHRDSSSSSNSSAPSDESNSTVLSNPGKTETGSGQSRSGGFRMSLDSGRAGESRDDEKLGSKIKGRLRAWTAGARDKGERTKRQLYPGT